MANNPTPTAPAFLDTKEVCQTFNYGLTKFKELRASGGFGVKPLRAGKKLLYPAAEIQSYIEASTQAGHFITFDKWQKMRGVK